MSVCPYGASVECLFNHPPEAECHFWSPLKKTCIMSSNYDEDEAEEAYWLYKMRKEKMSVERQTLEGFLKDLEQMKVLECGWLDGEGKRISKAVIDFAESRIVEGFGFRPPQVFPTPEGGLSLEWDTDEELDAEIGPDLKGIMIWKDTAVLKDWAREESWAELQACWREAALKGVECGK